MARRSSLGVVFLTIFLDLLGFGIILPISAFYAQQYHATEQQIGLLGATYSLAQLLFVPLWGRLSDRIGRRPVILVSIAGTVVSMALFGWAPSLFWLFFARAFGGAMTANIATVQAYIADSTTGADRARGMGLVGAAFGLGFILGPFIGGVLGELGRGLGWGYGIVGYGSALLAAINFTLAFFFLPESLPRELRGKASRARGLDALKQALALPGLWPIVLVSAAATFAFANMEQTFALLTQERLHWTEDAGGARSNGYVFAYIGIIASIVQGGLIGPLTRRFGERTLLFVGLPSTAIGLGLLGAVNSLPVLLLACTFISLGNGLATPSISSLTSKCAPADQQGGVLGLSQSVGALSRVLGPASGGALFQYLGSPFPFVVGGTVMGIAWLLALGLVKLPAAPRAAVAPPAE